MVSFVCDSCQKSVKLNKGSEHLGRCRGPLSCVDCGKTFGPHEFSAHKQCVTEQEKYEKKRKPEKPAPGAGDAKRAKKADREPTLREKVRAVVKVLVTSEPVSLRQLRKQVVAHIGHVSREQRVELLQVVLETLCSMSVAVKRL